MSKNPETKKIFMVLLVFAAILSSFYLLDFKAARSETQANSLVSTYSLGNPESGFPNRIFLYTEGDSALAANLKEKLRRDLDEAGAEVIIVDSMEEKYSSQALLVNISRGNLLYTPFYASSNLNIMFFYTSTGQGTKYFEQFKKGNKTIVFENNGSIQGEKLIAGEIKLHDSTHGPVSLKAYRKHLASGVSEEVLKQLKMQLQQNI